MELTSPEFTDGGPIPQRFTCDGDDLSPALGWSEIPEGAAELVLICEDPDAPGRTFVHWLVWGIDAGSSGTDSGQAPAGCLEGGNDFGRSGYGGPCPPPGHGTHHYRFVLHAVKQPLDLSAGASADELRAAISTAGVIEEATLVGTYSR